MADLNTHFRTHYRPSGRVDLARFAAFSAGVVGVAMFCAWVLWLGFEHRFYAPLLFALGIAMVVGGLALLAVRLGHCRSPAAALCLGLVAGLIVQPGHHILAYLIDLQSGAVVEPTEAVRHLDRRLSEVTMNWAVPPRLDDSEQAEPSRGDYLFLWAATVCEIIFIPLLCGLPSLLRVLRNPYCETSGEWAKRTRLAFVHGSEEPLRQALDGGRIAEVAPRLITEYHPNQPAQLGLLDVCPQPSLGGTAGYLSLRKTRGEAVTAVTMEPLFPYHRLQVRCAALNAREMAALQALTPEQATATVIPSWADAVVDHTRPAQELARLETIEQSQPPAVDRRTRQIAELLNLGPLLTGLVTGFGLLFAAASIEDSYGTLTNLLGLSGFAVMIAGIWVAVMDLNLVSDRYLLHRLFLRLAQRPDLKIRPEDEDALRVALVPRTVWSGGSNELIDHGLLVVRDAIVYEGDRHRMWIPAASIQALYVESLTVDQYQTWHFTMLEVQAADGLHTLPFVRIAAPIGETLFRSKKRRAEVMFTRLLDYVERHHGN